MMRGLSLVEAISRDLLARLLKVLSTRRLMHVSYEDFERIMLDATEVFKSWEDEYEKLQVRRC